MGTALGGPQARLSPVAAQSPRRLEVEGERVQLLTVFLLSECHHSNLLTSVVWFPLKGTMFRYRFAVSVIIFFLNKNDFELSYRLLFYWFV